MKTPGDDGHFYRRLWNSSPCTLSYEQNGANLGKAIRKVDHPIPKLMVLVVISTTILLGFSGITAIK